MEIKVHNNQGISVVNLEGRDIAATISTISFQSISPQKSCHLEVLSASCPSHRSGYARHLPLTRPLHTSFCDNYHKTHTHTMVKSSQPLQIRLTEPVIFLKGPSTGLDFRGRPQTVRQDGQPAMVRGLLTLRLNKPTRIRSITIKLEGKARTEWPEGRAPVFEAYRVNTLMLFVRYRGETYGNL